MTDGWLRMAKNKAVKKEKEAIRWKGEEMPAAHGKWLDIGEGASCAEHPSCTARMGWGSVDGGAQGSSGGRCWGSDAQLAYPIEDAFRPVLQSGASIMQADCSTLHKCTDVETHCSRSGLNLTKGTAPTARGHCASPSKPPQSVG